MMIHAGLLTHDAAVPGLGKIIDLGFNGDFDVKNNAWNTVFVQVTKNASVTKNLVVSILTSQELVVSTTEQLTVENASNVTIGTFTIPAATIKKGGVVGVKMPKGIKRYFTLLLAPSATDSYLSATKCTAGITDQVDTDLAPDFTNLGAATKGVGQPGKSEALADLVAGTSSAYATPTEVSSAIAAASSST